MVSVLDLIPLDLDQYRQLGLNARLFLQKISPRADRILALSHFTAERITDLLGVGEEKIVVAPLPPADAFHPRPSGDAEGWLSRQGIRGPYIVAMADGRTKDPRKRNEWLPTISRQLKQADAQLVVVGPECQRLFERDAGVITLDRVADGELGDLLAAARALVFTSSYEGQGMPPLEAMACGTPVVAMRNTAMPEVVGAGGILVDEKPPGGRTAAEELAEACVELTRDAGEREGLSRLALEQSGSFTLSAFAAAVSRAYLG